MEFTLVGASLALLEGLGAAVSIIIFLRLYRLYKLIGEQAILLSGISFAIFGVGLILELAGNIASLLYYSGPTHGRRPAEITLLLANRGVLLASPLYISSYTLYTVSLYLEHVRVASSNRLVMLGAPLLFEVYVDNNIVSLALLAAATYIVVTRSSARIPWIIFVLLLFISHILFIVAGITVNSTAMATGLALRAIAPLAFSAAIGKGGKH